MNIKDITGAGATYNVQTMNVIVVNSEQAAEKVINPGIEYGEDGKAKFSPPLQQQLTVMKDAVGPSTDDVTIEPTEQQAHTLTVSSDDSEIARLKKYAAIFGAV